MEISGFREDTINWIIRSGVKGYERKKVKAEKAGKPVQIHRNGNTTVNTRFTKKILRKENWFKNLSVEEEENDEPEMNKTEWKTDEGKEELEVTN